MPTLILPPRFTEDAQLLWRAASELGWSTERLSGWRVTDHLLTVTEPVIYVEPLFAPMVAEQFGIEFKEPPIDFLPSLPEHLRRRTITLSTFGEVAKLSQPMFVKTPNDKMLAARVYDGDFPQGFTDDVVVLIAEPVQFVKEFRCFIAQQTVRTLSIYHRDGELQRAAGYRCEPDELDEARRFAESVLREITLPETIVLDVGLIQDRGWAVIELNAAWGSGVYGCDPAEVLDVLRMECRKG